MPVMPAGDARLTRFLYFIVNIRSLVIRQSPRRADCGTRGSRVVMGRDYRTGGILILTAALAAAVLTRLFEPYLAFHPTEQSPLPTATSPFAPALRHFRAPQFLSPRIEDAPDDIRELVTLGYRIVTETGKHAEKYVGNGLTCSNCHFRGGLTDGGRDGGLSLVGVAAKYPCYLPQRQEIEDLMTRINGCFQRSMNGRRLPADSREMLALLTYCQWISKGIPVYAEIDWLKPRNFESPNPPDPSRGEQVYITRCSVCHGSQGQGTEIAPPLWGDRSFNSGAGFQRMNKLAGFIDLNMPPHNPVLASREISDVAAYIVAQPRPAFQIKP